MHSTDLTYTIFIKTTPEKLWQAITNPEFSRQYWGGHGNVSDWSEGARWQHQDTNDHNAIRVMGKVLECTPPSRLVLSWYAPDQEADHSILTFTLEPLEDMVRLRVVHGSFIPHSKMATNVANGWPLVLSSLKSYLETGTGIDIMAIFKKQGGCGGEAAT